MHVGIVVYGGLDELSGGYRYDRHLVSHLRAQGDTVEVIALPWRTYPRHLTDAVSRRLRTRLDRPFDVLLQDELCHPSLWRHNPHLEEPTAVVSLVHLLRSNTSLNHLLSNSTPPNPGLPGLLYRAVERRYLDSVDAVVCTSRHTETAVQSLLNSTDSLPSLVAYPGGRMGRAVSRETVRRRAVRDPFRVVFVGNLVPRKGVLDLLAALDGLDGDWEAALVGSHRANPGYARTVVRRVNRLAGGAVTVHGAVDDRQLQRQLRRAHVLAVPSRYEGFGMVYLEAMEYGVVPLASAAGGADEIVEDGTSGYLVEPGDVEGLRDCLAQLRDDRERLAELATEALETAVSHPDWSASMREVREFLLEASESRGEADGR